MNSIYSCVFNLEKQLYANGCSFLLQVKPFQQFRFSFHFHFFYNKNVFLNRRCFVKIVTALI